MNVAPHADFHVCGTGFVFTAPVAPLDDFHVCGTGFVFTAPVAQGVVNTTQERTAPVLDPSPQELKAPRWMVTVYDNDKNTYEEVITILVLATGCTEEEAYIEAWEVDHFGKSVVHLSDEEDCRRAAEIIRVIGIRVEVTPEE